MKGKTEIIAALDLGTSKVTVLVAEVCETGMTVLGVGTAQCEEGLRRGMVISIARLVDAIKSAKRDAEQMSGYMVTDVVAAIGGVHVLGVNNRAMVSPRHGEIVDADVCQVLEMATALPLPVDRRVINVVPREYSVDEHDGIRDPLGMSGVRLDADVHLITAAKAAVDNIRKCAERAGLRITQLVASPLASALAVLEDSERELGVVVLDLGAGTGDLTVWAQGSLVHTAVIGAGGELITRDIATGLRTPSACAESLKIAHGSAWAGMVSPGDTVEVPGVGGRDSRTLARHYLTEIIEPRVCEIFRMVQADIQKSGYEDFLAGGLVLTGGAANMPGMVELGDEVLNLPVRIGVPRGVKGLSSILEDPALSTAYGLALFASLPFREDMPQPMLPCRPPKRRGRLVRLVRKVMGFMT